jgi:hypothetical protein
MSDSYYLTQKLSTSAFAGAPVQACGRETQPLASHLFDKVIP